MNDYYPPWGFYYQVKFGDSQNKNDVRFQTVSGLSVEYDMEEYKEGGENRFVHKLPVRTSSPRRWTAATSRSPRAPPVARAR